MSRPRHPRTIRTQAYAGAVIALTTLLAPQGARPESRPFPEAQAPVPRTPHVYRLQPGDAIEVAVAGQPDLRARATVQIDGTISLPTIGTLLVAGETTGEVMAKIEAVLASRLLRRQRTQAADRLPLLQPGDVAVTVAEYRPVTVSGDVLTPGQYAYRPMMTARHAIAVAGGASTVRGRVGSISEGVEAEQEYRRVQINLVKEHVHLWRLAAEMEGAETFKAKPINAVSVPPGLVADLVRTENRSLQVAQAETRAERDYLVNAARQAAEQIATLTEQEVQEERGLKADIEELSRTNNLFGNGNLTSQRVADARRAVLLSSTRRLQTSANLSEAKRRRDEMAWRRDRIDTSRELLLLKEVRDGQAQVADLSARLEASTRKLALIGRAQSLQTTTLGPRPEVVVVRRNGAAFDRLTADEDFELQPGDAVEVIFGSETLGALAAR
ncbi:polysaccharide export protein [Methylorubrum extorquens PA1]|nr:polysaccharide export protein [Methylorubrum extorquens PA1]